MAWRLRRSCMAMSGRSSSRLPGRSWRLATVIWMVSDPQGRGMRPVAEFEISDLYFNRPDLVAPQWTPDGKHVSFEYKRALYLMPVD